MPDENLLKYIRDGLAQGRTEDILRPMLASAGWAQKDVDDAFVFVKTSQMPATQPVIQPPVQAPAQPVVRPSQPSMPLQSQAPAHQPIAPISPMADTMPEDRGVPLWRNSRMIVGLIVFVVCVAGVGVAFAYYSQPSLSPGQVLSKTYTAMQAVKTYSFVVNGTSTVQVPTSSLALVGPSVGNGSIFISGSASGSMDISDPTDIKESLVVNVSASTGTKPTFGGTVEYMGLGGVYYIKIDNIDLGAVGGAAEPNPVTSMLQFFIGSWFKIDTAEIQQTLAAKLGTSTLSVEQSSTQLTADKIQQIKALAAQYQIVSVDKTLPDQTIDGQDTYHYSLTVNKANLAEFIAKASTVVSGQSFSAAEIASTTAAFNDVDVKDLEIWIGKKDFLVYKSSGDIAISPGNAEPMDDIQFSDLNSGYGQPVTITAPAGAKDVAQILAGFMGGFGSSLPATTKAQATVPAPSKEATLGGTVTFPEPPSDSKYNNLEFKVSSVYVTELTMTVTDHSTGKSATVTLNVGQPEKVLGYTMTVTGIKQVIGKNNLGQTVSWNQATLSYQQQ